MAAVGVLGGRGGGPAALGGTACVFVGSLEGRGEGGRGPRLGGGGGGGGAVDGCRSP